MTAAPINVTQYELAVLDVLWTHEQATIRQITEQIYGQSQPAAYATVQKLLERLEKKRCVARDRGGPAHRFRATVERGDLISQGLESLADKLCSGSLTPLLIHLAQRIRLTKRDRDMLRKLIKDA